ncbi:hypothetical protein KCTCHS21_29740 [Cohnella abietis]|uniref:Uncharacterized protein n=1 Tax=Cohnella abietis TaxID=2507935 RepID=A0A3T1D675_9BACL|nr:hypothetical protein KCTCHS21_29740 [Cohnella abietis]
MSVETGKNITFIVLILTVISYAFGSFTDELNLITLARIFLSSTFIYIALDFAYHFFIRPKP